MFYVWFDAPIGYISITADYTKEWEKWWKNPEEVEHYEFMAKDNVPFHSVVFPATLLGSESSTCKWTMVKHLMATEYLNYEDAKFSKSRGIGVFGNDAADTEIPSDIWRFYLIYTRPENADSAFKWDDFMLKNNSELLANLGNFVNRALKFCKDSFGGRISEIIMNEGDKKVLIEINGYLNAYQAAMEICHLRESISEILNISRRGNQLMQAEKPWALLKSAKTEDKLRASSVVSFCANIAALISLLIEPFMPKLSSGILKQLNITLDDVNILKGENAFKCFLKPGHTIGVPEPLIREIKKDEIEALQKRFAGPQKEREKSVENSKHKEKQNPAIIKQIEEGILVQSDVIEKMATGATSNENMKDAKDILEFLKKQLEITRGNCQLKENKGSKKGMKK